jgi:anhydro-N-acetylmuramic acid kinase
MTQSRLVIGAMSGTSADGVDAAVVRIDGRGVGMTASLVAHRHHPYEADLRHAIFRARADADPVRLGDLARMARRISLAYAGAARDAMTAAHTSAGDVAAIAAHGQTLFHDPPDAIQWLDPAVLAAETGCTVVSDFRRADCAAGGQGAPLVPFADYVLFRHPTRTRVLLNLGGIANLTHLRAGGTIGDVVAFDTGPGNCVSDALVRAVDPTGPGVDVDGATAARGVPIHPLLQDSLADPYFAKPPPKSTDVPAMLGLFNAARQAVGRNYPFEYLLRTACLLTATTVADAIRRFCDPFPDELIVSGGGVRNATLMELLRQPLGAIPVIPIDDLGFPSEAKEAVAFALLGAATLDGEPSNVPAATGAKHAAVLGSITPRP